jgi:hypothetical protein
MRRQYPQLAAGQYQGHVTMTAKPPGSPVTEAVGSLEVRWIFPGQLDSAVAGWFGRFPARTESREDTYLLDPQLRGLSVKIRGGGALEVKAYRGSPGILVSREGVTLTSGDGSRTMVYAIDCERGGSAA